MSTELQKFDELQTQITLFVAPAKDVRVIDSETSTSASTIFRELTSWEKKVEEKRKSLVGPLNDQVKRINEYAKQVTAPLADAKAHITKELIAFEKILEAQRQEQLRIEREEQRKRDEEARLLILKQQEEAAAKIKAAQEEAEMDAMFSDDGESIKRAEAEAEAIKAKAEAEARRIEFEAKKEHWDAKKEIATNKVAGTRRTWTYKIIDISKVPPEYLVTSIDDKKVKKSISLEVREIPGLEIYQELTITAR